MKECTIYIKTVHSFMFNYGPYIDSLAHFMEKEGYTSKPFPKVRFKKEKMEGVFVPTANYEPDAKVINLYVSGRAPKDCLRSIAHELIHHQQNIEGRLSGGAYSGDKITEDNKLIKLEEEAYLKGNIAFRRWTETANKENKVLSTTHKLKICGLVPKT